MANPFDGWRLRLARRKQLPKSLSKVEASSLLSTSSTSAALATQSDRTIAIAIRLMVSTGLRVGELCSLQRDDVLSQGAALRVRGKGARDRIAYVSDTTLAQELTHAGKLRMAIAAPCFSTAPVALSVPTRYGAAYASWPSCPACAAS